MIDREHPCARGLTPNCFEAYPEWAKRAFAYRLMHTLFPGRITRLLPRALWEPLIGEGAEIPPDVVLPPGTVVPPWYTWDLQWTPWFFLDFDWWVDLDDLFPDDWETGDPLPPGVVVDPEYVFPPGWKPGDPLPPGVDVDPGVTFPPGWTPDLPLPPGVTIDPIQVLPPGWNPRDGGPPPIMLRPNLPPEAVESGPAPPAYTQIWEPGPVHAPVSPPITGVEPWFNDDFDTLDPNVWDRAGDDPTRTYVQGGWLVFEIEDFGPRQKLYAWGYPDVRADVDIIFRMNHVSGVGRLKLTFDLYDTTFLIEFEPTANEIIIHGDVETRTLTGGWTGAVHDYLIEVRSEKLTLYQGGNQLTSNLTLRHVSWENWQIYFYQYASALLKTDYIRITPV